MTRALVLLAVVACSGRGPRQIGAEPSWRHGSSAGSATAAGTGPVGPVTFAPSGDAVSRYNEPVQAPPHTPLGDATIAAVREAAQKIGIQPPVADARLFKTCAELAKVVPEDGGVSYSLEEFSMQRNGIIEPSPRVIITWADPNDVGAIVEQLRPMIPEILAGGDNARVGIGVAKRAADGTGAIVFALQASGLTTNPIPRSLPAGGSVLLDAVVDVRYHDPDVFITHEDGTTERLVLNTGKSGGFKTEVRCGRHTGRQQVEIGANDVHGAQVLANFPVWCGDEPPSTFTVEPSPDDDAVPSDEAEKRLLALVNRDRLTAGLTALVWDDRVADVARQHSEEMRRTKIVAHIISPASGAADARVKAAGIKTGVVLENVARAYGVGQAHEALMNSPGHRANLMSPLATHVGIGIALGDEVPGGRREMFVTQVFIRVPPKIDPAQAAELVRVRIEKVHPVSVNAKLASVAQELADGLAAGKSRESLWPRASKQLDGLSGTYQRVGSSITALADLAEVDGKQLVDDYKPDEIGVGIAQGTHPDIGEGAVWIVVLMAERLQQPPLQPPPAGPRR